MRHFWCTILGIMNEAIGAHEPGRPARLAGRRHNGICWWSLLGDLSGFPVEGRLFLGERGIAVRAPPLPRSEREPESILSPAERAVETTTTPLPDDHLTIIHHAEPRTVTPRGARVVWRTMYATDRAPDSYVAASRQIDEIWVPSRFTWQAFVASGIEASKVFVLPEPIDTSLFDPARTTPFGGLPSSGYTFLAVGTWCHRKGWDILLRAYFAEFTAADDTLLVMHTHHGPDSTSVPRLIDSIRSGPRHVSDPPRVHLSTVKLATKNMPMFYRACDAFVLASPGEGWGRP